MCEVYVCKVQGKAAGKVMGELKTKLCEMEVFWEDPLHLH